MKITRRDWIEYVFWVVVTFVFLYERRYLIQKAGLGYFIECVAVRVSLIVTLTYWNLYGLIPRFFETKRYFLYFALVLGSAFIYVALQSAYDIYLYGFVIGSKESRDFWSIAPYNFVVTIWYLALTVALHRAIDWYVQSEELAKLYEENKILKEQVGLQNAMNGSDSTIFFLKTGTKKVKIDLDELTHIQGLKDYSIIYTSDDIIVVRGNLRQMEQLFPEGKLLRIHKSYLVDPKKIESIDRNKVLLKDLELPIGRNYKEQVNEYFVGSN